ncbi:MAG TPA: response regulator [Bryobacteraceae bacterium]|jgi:DNA-binding NtrC family response regulator
MNLTNQPETPATILLLGSEPVLRTVIGEVLDQAGYVVLSKGDLGSAVDALAEINVDLLITHPYIANISGHKAAQYLLTKNPRMGVLIVGGLLDDDRLTYRAELEQFEIFPKPFAAAELVKKVKEVLQWVREKQARMSQSNLDRSTADAVQD